MAEDDGKKKKVNSPPKIEVGCGVAKGDDSYATGREAASLALTGISTHPLSAVIAFAPDSYQLDLMLSGVRSITGNAPLFGASSAGEICNGTFSGSVAVMALASPFLSVSVSLGQNVSADWHNAVHEALGHRGMARYFTPQDSLYYNEMIREGRSTFAMLLSPGSTIDSPCHSPEILEELKALCLGRIPFFGGSAVDTSATTGRENFVFFGDSAYPDSMVLAVFETSLKFGTAMGNGFHPTAKKALVTKARSCEVLELDGKPAADVFAELHDLPRKSMEIRPLFEQEAVKPFGMRHPLGQYSIFVPQSFTPEGGLILAHPVAEGTPLALMESIEDEVAAAGKDTLQRAMMQSGITEPAAILIFSCFLRKHLLKDRFNDEISAITDILPGVPLVGFYCAGEQGIYEDHVSRHNNETVVVLLLGNDLSYAARVAEENRNLHRMLEIRLAEQKRLEARLAEQVHFLQTLIDTIPSPIFYKDLKGSYLGCNKAYEEYNGISRKSILGRSNRDFLPPDQSELHSRADAALSQKGGKVQYECLLTRNTGRHFHVLNNKAIFHRPDGSQGGIVGVLIDITSLKHTEDALRASEEKFLKAFHNNPTMMIISTVSKGRIIEVNESYLRTMGFAREDIIGKASWNLQTYVDPEQRDSLLKRLDEGPVRNFEVPLLTKDGAIRYCLLSTELIRLQKVDHILVLLQDITDRKLAEGEQLKRMRLQSILDMAGTICHEFNQPMQILSGYTDLLLSHSVSDPKIRKKLETIREQTARMGMITRKLMNIKDGSAKDYIGIGTIMDIHKAEEEDLNILKGKESNDGRREKDSSGG